MMQLYTGGGGKWGEVGPGGTPIYRLYRYICAVVKGRVFKHFAPG